MPVVRLFTFRRLLEKNGRLFLQQAPKRFSSSCPGFKIDKDNIMNSPFSDVSGFQGILLHDFLLEKVDKWHDRTAVECFVTGKSYTYNQLRKLSSKFATSLRKCKLQPGDTIALVMSNVPEYAIVMLGASKAGIRTCLLNPAYTRVEIRKQVLNSGSLAVVVTSAKYNDVEASIQNNSNVRLPIIVVNDRADSTPAGAIKFEDLVRDDVEEFSGESGIDAEDDIALPYSSGTTGLPKGVQLSHRNIVANLTQITHDSVRTGEETTKTHQDVIPLMLPLYHIYGLVVILFTHLRDGAKMVCLPEFSATQFINLLDKHRPHILYAVPPIIQMMANNKQVQPRHAERMRLVLSGAAPIGEESIAQFRNRISPTLTFGQGYGMTEASPCLSFTNKGPSASGGYIVSNTQVRIVRNNEDGTTNLGLYETGEIYARGPQIMKGYYMNPQATTDTMDGDWIKTGDLGYCTNEGLLYIKGRLKELIKVKGFQVPPAELEELIRGVDKVQDVAVIGVPDERSGEVPKAFIVPKPGTNINEDEIKAYVAERAAAFKHLGYVQFVESIPKSPAGKILRKELEKW